MTLAKRRTFGYQFRQAMRRLTGGVAIITAGKQDEITGMTVTSLTSLSADPPRLLVNINRRASSFSLIARHKGFGVNILGANQRDIAERFSNGRFNGKERFDGFAWTRGASGVPLLSEALAALECEVDEIIERYSHGDCRRTPRLRRTVPAAIWPRILALRVCRDWLSPDFDLIAAAGSSCLLHGRPAWIKMMRRAAHTSCA